MKALLIFLIIVAVVGLWFDDKSKRADLDQAQAQAAAAEQQSVAAQQQVQHLTAEVSQLQAMVNRPVAGQPAASGQPAWFQQHLDGAKGVLDPNSGPP
jgi:multidrug resistance efflux pump